MNEIINVITWPFRMIISILHGIVDILFVVVGSIAYVLAIGGILIFVGYWVVAILFGGALVFYPFIEHYLR